MYSKELVKGHLQPIILNLLRENKRMYGYEITQKVKELTKGKIEITEGALYPALHKLELEGILETEEEYIGKRVRKYYKLTAPGTKVVKERLHEFSEFLALVSSLVNPKPNTTL